MRISNYPTDTLTGDELILATDVDTSTQKYKTVNFTVDTLKTFLVGTDDTNEFTNITLGGSLKFEGSSADGHETTLGVINPDGDRTINLPNQSGTLPVLAVASTTAITSTPEELNILTGVTATATEINALDGITVSTNEINKLAGFTGTPADLNYAKDLRATGVTATEFDTLDGVNSTLTAAELNILDGVTATAAEINYLAGASATAANNKALIADNTNSISLNGGNVTNIQKVDTNIVNVSDDANTLQSGAISLTDTVSPLSTGSSNNEATTLAAPTGGLVKILVFVADGGGDMVTTVTNAGWKSGGGTGTITFDTIGDACTLVYAGSKWYVSGNNGCTFA
jgi:hypothetical protein